MKTKDPLTKRSNHPPTPLSIYPLLWWLALLTTLNFQPSTVFAQGTAFTYQGWLSQNSSPASGLYDMRFSVWDAATNGTRLAGLTNSAVAVSGGLFTVTLDFGSGVFTGPDRWLNISVRTNGSTDAYSILWPRQQLTPAPYAVLANSASNLLGSLPAAQLTGTAGTLWATNIVVSGAISGNGAGLTNVNADSVGGVPSSGFWRLSGNNVAAGQYLGSLNNQPVEMRVNGLRALRLEPGTSTNGAPNVIGGSEVNYVSNSVVGATIGGGGAIIYNGSSYTNAVTANFGTVVGGAGNAAGGVCAIVCGGSINIASGHRAMVGGGALNTASQEDSFVGGGFLNSANGLCTVLGGGRGSIANASYATIAGGYNNMATNSYATVPGGSFNVAGGRMSLAAGQGAQALQDGAFVWADSSSAAPFASTAANEFSVRAQNGVRIASPKGIHLDAGDNPIIVRDWDPFDGTAPANKQGIGRWGLFMEPFNLVVGIPAEDVGGRGFQVCKYPLNGTPVPLMTVVNQSGYVGIGTWSPAYQLQLTVDLAAKPNGGSWANSSDARLKKNIQPMTGALDKLAQLRGVTFEWVNPEDHAGQTGEQAGFIAQEVEKVFPKWVTAVQGAEHDKALTADGKVKSLSLPFQFDAMVVEAIKELKARNESLHAENAELRQQLKELKGMVLKLTTTPKGAQ